MSDDITRSDVLEPDELARFLMALRALGDGPVPAPAPAVVAMFGDVVPVRSRPVRRAAVRVALVAAVTVGGLVAAAANHSLPSPAQRVVSNVVNDLTPFDIGPNHPPAMPTAPPTRPTRPRAPERESPAGEDGPTSTDDAPEPHDRSETGSAPEPEHNDRGTQSGEPEPRERNGSAGDS